MADHIPSICEFDGCQQDSVFRCATCDLWTCEEHHDHGPVGDGPHLAVGSDATRIAELTSQLADRDREIERLKAAFEPVEDWYNAEEAPTQPTFVDMLEMAVSDLQEDRQALLASDREITRLRADKERLVKRLDIAAPWTCGDDCGKWVAVDEDGCCITCGADAARGEGG